MMTSDCDLNEKELTLFNFVFRVHIPAFLDAQSNGGPAPYSYIYVPLLDCKNSLYAPDKLSYSGIRQLHCVRDRFPESVPVLQFYGHSNLPSGVSGSCSMRLDKF